MEIEFALCNRGTATVGSGIEVAVYDDDPDVGGTEICRIETARILDVGDCLTLTCLWVDPPRDGFRDLYIVADAGEDRTECLEGNNRAVLPDVGSCAGPG